MIAIPGGKPKLTKEVAKGSYRNSYAYTGSVKDQILQVLDDNVRGFLVKQIAQRIDANPNYISRCCRKLYDQGLIFRRNLGIAYEYYSKVQFPGNLYRQKQASNVTFTQVHGLCMKTKYDIAKGDGLGLGLGEAIQFGKTYSRGYQPFRFLSYRFGANGVLTVWLKCSDAPLGFEDFKHFLTEVQGLFRIAVWTRMDEWIVTQYGMNRDIGFSKDLAMHTNEQIVLFGLGQFMCQVYNKKLPEIGDVQRIELHGWEPIIAKEFFAIFQGGVSEYVQKQMSTATNALVRELTNQFKGFSGALNHILLKEAKKKRDPEDSAATPIIRQHPPGGT